MRETIDRILFSEQQILHRVDEMAEEITRDYEGKELTLVALLNGSLVFLADLMRRISLPIQVACLRASSYDGAHSTNKLLLEKTPHLFAKGRHVLLIDDILDTGLTLKTAQMALAAESQAESVKTCVLLKKNIERPHAMEPDYFGFEIENEFVVGYGLDYMQRYRHLPHIGVLKLQDTPSA